MALVFWLAPLMATYSILSKAILQCRVGFPAVLEGTQQGLCQNAKNSLKPLKLKRK